MSEPSTSNEPLLRVSKLTKQFPLPGGIFSRSSVYRIALRSKLRSGSPGVIAPMR